ncbi:MAG TPA: hypothetical protein ENK96_04905, partial [Desulfobulbaceae bacterium]|nr:hypothetical protein [Desulfobulbaceae bacterium]
MAKKKRRRKKNSGATRGASQPAKGKKFLSTGQFSQAIKIFRRLYKETGDDQWRQPLLAAFSGRINQLTAKMMHKEALGIYQNAKLLFPHYSPGLHVFLLLKAGKINEAAQTHRKAAATLAKKQKHVIEETFAALLLSGQESADILTAFPDDSALLMHFPHADRALRAYSLKQDADALASLQHIPFRSPYRNFRLALKGMIVFHSRPDEAVSLFEKINHDSPFFRITLPYRQLLPGTNERTNQKTFSPFDRKIIQSLTGLNGKTIILLDSLRRCGKTPSSLYQCLVTSGKCLGHKKLRKICYHLLPHAPEKFSDFLRRFGGIRDRFEACRLQALAMEIEAEYAGVAEAWEDACKELIQKKNPADNLKIALLYRHVAEVMEKYPGEYDVREIREKLQKSLQYDPDDRETCLRIFHLLQNSPAEQYRYLNEMLEQFPGDTDILLLGVEAATRRGAFKKASRLAQQLLKIDPINTRVRHLLIDAHLAHARKLSGLQKFELACRECEAAALYDRANLGRGKIEICHGLIVLLSGDEAGGMELVAVGEDKAESPLLARFRLYTEALLLGLPKKWSKSFTSRLKTELRSTLDQNGVLQIVDQIKNLEGEKEKTLQSIVSAVIPWLKKGAKLNWPRDAIRSLCHFFYHKRYHDLLSAYAEAATKKKFEDPLLLFYSIYAKTAGGKKRLTGKQYNQLNQAWNDARLSGDRESA